MALVRQTIAIAYDFDGTLAPGNMQEHQFLPDIGIKPHEFWGEVGRLTKENQADKILIYMHLMLKSATAANVPVRRKDFKEKGNKIKLFSGVDSWFDRINSYAHEHNVKLEHYLISSGNAEIFSGTSIARFFNKVYASKFLFNENGVACWPALAVNYTTKTQYLFRINKKAHDLGDDKKINTWIEKDKRPVPFENMIFIGDGETDVPCFRLMKDLGGLSIAVYDPSSRGGRKKALQFIAEGRVNVVSPANYCAGTELDRIIKAKIDLVSSQSNYNNVLSNPKLKK